jgi:hypothetical protein
MGRKDVLMFFRFIKEFSTKHQELFKKVLDEFQKAHKQDTYMRSYIKILHRPLNPIYIIRYSNEALNRTNLLRVTFHVWLIYTDNHPTDTNR